jgi:spore coat protein CotH
MRIRQSSIAIVVGLMLATSVSAQTNEQDVFDSTQVQDVYLQMNARDLIDLREHWDSNTFYPADFTHRDVRVRNVGVRSRGWGSRNGIKPGLRIDFNHYISAQRFADTAALVLDNLWQDPSMVREAAAMAFIARMGEAASRESFARVFINGDFQGVYAVVEEPNTGYLQRRFGKETGALFEYHWVRAYDFSGLGDRLDEYELLFERRTHESDPAAPVYEPLQAMIDANSYPVGAAWREQVETYLDLPQMIRYAAVEAFLGEIDGFTGYAGVNNFYVYRPDGSTRHMFLPWDRDHTMWQLDLSIFERVNGNRLLYNALAHSDLRALYLDTIERCAKSAVEDKWLEAQVRRLSALVDSAAPFDTRLPYTKEKHDGEVANVIDFAQRRSSFVLKEIADARRTMSARSASRQR